MPLPLSGASFLPKFPQYGGPYKVGSMDLEIPVKKLRGSCVVPREASNIETIQFRIFYPAVPESNQGPAKWAPDPSRLTISAYVKFMGYGSKISQCFSFLTPHLRSTTMPVHSNAVIHQPNTENGKWPVIIFSHGLGGNRNSYSFMAGSLASHGTVVFCPEHRDGTAVITTMRFANCPPNSKSSKKSRVIIPYNNRIYLEANHEIYEADAETYEARESQLRIRLWEVGVLHEAVLAINRGDMLTNLGPSASNIHHFGGLLHVDDPGSIIFGGHSFGAVTMYQLLKSVYYADVEEVKAMKKRLMTPKKSCPLRKQITEQTPLMLLDMWCLPLLAPNSKPLLDLPLPMYADVPSAPGGSGIMAIESERFFLWKQNLRVKARLLSPDPKSGSISSGSFDRADGTAFESPNFFYVVNSAHLSQSDFGVLFPWITKKFFHAHSPERTIWLNVRALLQFFKTNGVSISRTPSISDGPVSEEDLFKDKQEAIVSYMAVGDDWAILEKSNANAVENWKWVDLSSV